MENIEKELENFKSLKYRIREEGLHYTLMHYSSWAEIDDREFQYMRNDYCNLAQKLEEYIDDKIEQLKELNNEIH